MNLIATSIALSLFIPSDVSASPDSSVSSPPVSFAAASQLHLPAIDPTVDPVEVRQDDVHEAPGTGDLPEVRLVRFAAADTWRFNFSAAGAGDFDNGEFYAAFVGVSYFFVDNFGIDLELGPAVVDQDGTDAWGVNLNVLLRWHFLARESWSLYLDGGAGMLKTNHDVPDNGSNFNFTPQAGGGVSFDVGGSARVMTGIRWHHISNADTFDSNPGRDSLMVYAGLSVPF